LRNFPPVSELGQSFDRGFVGLKIADQNLHGWRVLRLPAGRLTSNRRDDGRARASTGVDPSLARKGLHARHRHSRPRDALHCR
jgi:hypothetical protein